MKVMKRVEENSFESTPDNVILEETQQTGGKKKKRKKRKKRKRTFKKGKVVSLF